MFFFSSRRRHTRLVSDWSSDVCSSDLLADKLGDFEEAVAAGVVPGGGAAEAALHALERLGYATAEADRALRQALAANEIGRASCRERAESLGVVGSREKDIGIRWSVAT